MTKESRYRIGNKLGRTLYRDNVLIGMMDEVADAKLVVELLNQSDGVPVTSEPTDKEILKQWLTAWEEWLKDLVRLRQLMNSNNLADQTVKSLCNELDAALTRVQNVFHEIRMS